MIRGVTLDLWDTVIADDSDEQVRQARGMASKGEARVAIVIDALLAEGFSVDRERLADALGMVANQFRAIWRNEHLTFSVTERLDRVLAQLGTPLPVDSRAVIVRALEEMELDPAPIPVPGAIDGVAALAARWPLAIVSDAVFSPGRCLREILRTHGLLDHFGACVFSDEAGRSKPDAGVFKAAAERLGVPLEAMVHVGDREHHDIRGAQAAGMKAVLFVAARDADLEGTAADAVCGNWQELLSIIGSL